VKLAVTAQAAVTAPVV
jgi:hypothetical protein